MKDNIKAFLYKLINLKSLSEAENQSQEASQILSNIREEATNILYDNLKEDIMFYFRADVRHSVEHKDSLHTAIITRNKTKFINCFQYENPKLEVLNVYFNEMDLILDILNDYMEELEKGKEEKVDNE